MTEANVRNSLDEAAETIEVAAPPTRKMFEREARRQRALRRRQVGLGILAAAAIAAPVAAHVATSGAPTAPAISHPQGKISAVTRPLSQEQGDCPVEAATDAHHSKLLLVHADCSTQVVPTSGSDSVTYAALSPDASAVALTAYSPTAGLEVLDLNTGTRQTIAQADDTLGDPVWSPDGSAIAFWRIDDGHGHIYVVQSNGDQWGQPRQITKGDTVDVSPAWSPDGAELAFDRHGQVWTVDVRSGTAHELSGAAAGLQQPFWGSDPGDLYALATSGDLPSSRFRVVKLNASTGAQVGTSQEIDGTASEAQVDPAGIQVVALVRPSVTTALMRFNRNLVQVSRVSIPDVLVTNLRPKGTR